MGSIASGIFDLLGGNPTQKEQNQFGDLSNFETGTGESGINAAQGYYGGILSGNPEEIAQTLAPEISAGQGQVEQNALQNAQFGNRSGGTNAATQAAQSQERGNIINLIGGLQQGAAAGEAGIGENMLPQASSNLGSEAGLAEQNRQRESADVGGIAQGVADIAMPFLGGMGASADPYETLYNAQNSQSGVGSSLEPSTSSVDDLLS